MSAIEFLREVGKHFPVNRMLARDVVKARLEAGISFTEFSYQLLQSHDFYELHQRYGCSLQFGGSDQWGNITAGVDYVRRRGAGPVHAITTPLVTKADGTKFGKTEGASVWLDPEMTSPYAFYQFWVNTDDGDVGSYLKYFSFADHDTLAELEKATAERPAAREAQRALARELTTLVHGAGRVHPGDRRLAGAVRAGFAGRTGAGDAGRRAGRGRPDQGQRAVDGGRPAQGLRSGASMNEARRTIGEGGAYINNERVTDPEATPDPATSCTAGTWCCAVVAATSPASNSPASTGAVLTGHPGPDKAHKSYVPVLWAFGQLRRMVLVNGTLHRVT